MRLFTALVIGVLVIVALGTTQTQAQAGRRCFDETGYCIEGRIRSFWEQNGGLPVFGLPITPQRAEEVEGRAFQTQWFERARLELHPENRPPYDVLMGRLGVDRLAQQGRDWRSFPAASADSRCLRFAETGHSICGAFRAYWERYGLEFDGRAGVSYAESLALFGLPLSDLVEEEIGGKAYQVQWFERARFELHPENQPPFDVLLGLLGNELGRAEPGRQVPTATSAPARPTSSAPLQTPTRRPQPPADEPSATPRPQPSATPRPQPSATPRPQPSATVVRPYP